MSARAERFTHLPPHVIERARRGDVADYLASRQIRFKPGRNAWALARCPSHKNGEESKPSFSINLETGGFFCFACGVKGGDIIALHRLMTGLSFRDAVVALAGGDE